MLNEEKETAGDGRRPQRGTRPRGIRKCGGNAVRVLRRGSASPDPICLTGVTRPSLAASTGSERFALLAEADQTGVNGLSGMRAHFVPKNAEPFCPQERAATPSCNISAARKATSRA